MDAEDQTTLERDQEEDELESESVCDSRTASPHPAQTSQLASPPIATTPSVSVQEGHSCRQCRQRKKKCDRVRPRCAGCVKSKVDCIYPTPTHRFSPIPKTPRPTRADLTAEIARLKARCQQLELRLTAQTHQPQQYPNTPSFTSPPVSRPSFTTSLSTTANTEISGSLTPRRARSDLIQRVLIRLLTREQDAVQSIRGTIGKQLGASLIPEKYGEDVGKGGSLWPPREIAELLVDKYFDLSYGIIQFVSRSTIQADLNSVYTFGTPDPAMFPIPDLRVYRLCIVFAVVAGRSTDAELTGYTLKSAKLHAMALKHIAAAFEADEITCFICICLLAVTVILEFVTMSPYEVSQIACTMSMEMRLHEERPDLPQAEQDERRRLFWSLFLVDRVISTQLVRPVAIPEEIITVHLPQSDMGGTTTQAGDMAPLLFLRHLVLLRRLNGVMLDKMYLAREIPNPEVVFTDLRNQIDGWWNDTLASVPPSTSSAVRNQGYSRHPLFELNYHLFIVNLYRPSRLFAQTLPARLPTLRKSASRAIELYKQLTIDRRIPYNYIQLNNIVVIAISLLYTLDEKEGDSRNVELLSWRLGAMDDISASEVLLSTFCEGWLGVSDFRVAFVRLANTVRAKITRSPIPVTTLPLWTASIPISEAGPSLNEYGDVDAIGGEGVAYSGGVDEEAPFALHQSNHGEDQPWDVGTIDVEAFLTSMGLADWRSGA